MKKIFISYRRSDTAVFTGRLFDRLTGYYDSNSVFLDISSIRSAVDYREAIKNDIKSSGVVLAIVGPTWAGEHKAPSRIDNSEDVVRFEIEQALAQKIPVIPVYLKDVEFLNESDLPAPLKQLAFAHACTVDPGSDFDYHVLKLRNEINTILFPSKSRLAAYFTRRYIRQNKKKLCACLLFLCLVVAIRNPLGRLLVTDEGFYTILKNADPSAFSGDGEEEYQISRGLPDRASLVASSDLVSLIGDTQESFDVFALTGASFYNNKEAILAALERGVRIRILLLDHSDNNKLNIESFFADKRDGAENAEMSRNNAKIAETSFEMTQSEAKHDRYSGTLEVRWWSGAFTNSFWVRDGHIEATSLAHVEITYFGDSMDNPSVRFGALSPRMIMCFQSQFDYMWAETARSDSSTP